MNYQLEAIFIHCPYENIISSWKDKLLSFVVITMSSVGIMHQMRYLIEENTTNND